MQEISISSEPPSTIAAVAQINRLPPEMLAAIFVHLSRQQPNSAGRKASYFVQDLISVTHVCRSWRQAAITAPELWTEVTMTDLEAVKVFLERSRSVPLNVKLGPGSRMEIGDDLFEAVVPHTHRFQQLSVLVPTPRLWLQNQFGNLTSLHITPAVPDFLPFFDMLRRCPLLEEMFLFLDRWGRRIEPHESPTVPLRHLRKLFLRSFTVGGIKYLLHIFDLRTNGIAIHLSGVYPGPYEGRTISRIQAMFPEDDSCQPSLTLSTKLELIFHTRPRTFIMHAVGPGFAMRIDLCPDYFDLRKEMSFTFHNVFPSVEELWVRGSFRVDTKLYGIEHLTALEKLVLIGRGSKVARNFRQALSPDSSGALPCPLLSAIDCHGNASEMREIFLLLRTRSIGHRLEKVRVPSSFIPLPADIASCVRDVGSLDIPSRTLHMYAMELPEFCFAKKGHKWWEPWKSRLN